MLMTDFKNSMVTLNRENGSRRSKQTDPVVFKIPFWHRFENDQRKSMNQTLVAYNVNLPFL
jgi:hypothetical protein